MPVEQIPWGLEGSPVVSHCVCGGNRPWVLCRAKSAINRRAISPALRGGIFKLACQCILSLLTLPHCSILSPPLLLVPSALKYHPRAFMTHLFNCWLLSSSLPWDSFTSERPLDFYVAHAVWGLGAGRFCAETNWILITACSLGHKVTRFTGMYSRVNRESSVTQASTETNFSQEDDLLVVK